MNCTLLAIKITLENNENDNLFNIINGNIYDVIIDKKMTSPHSMVNNQSRLMKSSSINNIPQNNKKLTPIKKVGWAHFILPTLLLYKEIL